MPRRLVLSRPSEAEAEARQNSNVWQRQDRQGERTVMRRQFRRCIRSISEQMKYVVLTLMVGWIATAPKLAEAAEQSRLRPKLKASYYFDSRDYNTLNIEVGGSLPLGFSVWGFTDFHGDQDNAGSRGELTRTFSEYRLSHGGIGELLNIPGLGVQAEYNDMTPGDNNLGRFGITYKHAVPIPELGCIGGKPGWLQLRCFPLETDGDGGQVSLIYFLPIHDRVSIAGFADINFIEGATDRWIVEPQLNVRIHNQFWAILEYRYNGFERANDDLDGEGWAVGMRVDF